MLSIIIVIASIVLAYFVARRFWQKWLKSQAVANNDHAIERELYAKLHSMNLKRIAEHSNTEIITRITAERIVECFNLGVHPQKLSALFRQFGITTFGRKNLDHKQIAVAAILQDQLLKQLRAEHAELYDEFDHRKYMQGVKEIQWFLDVMKDESEIAPNAEQAA